MLGNCAEKMVFISSTTNEWPQGLTMTSTSTSNMLMKQQQQQQQKIPQESPKCPRCDSSNTKFCYYNNYSLSQPRHFCKACKRYWTRGGTLRSVPVGGACRKNKKIKRSISAVEQPVSSSSRPTPTSSCPNTTHIQNSPFGLRQSPNLNSDNIGTLPYGNYFTSKISSHLSDDSGLGFDTQSQMNGLRLGFLNSYENYQNGSLVPPISSYSMSGSSINSPTIASLLGSTLNQQKFMNNIDGGNPGLRSFEELPIDRNFGLKVKPEEEQNCQSIVLQNHMEQTTTSDPILYWNATNVVAWHDPGNLGSSVP